MITPKHLEGSNLSTGYRVIPDILQGRSILLADDSMIIRYIVGAAVGGQGAIVYEAGNGQEAVELALALRPDIILMDMQMPLLDGIQATMQLRSIGLQHTKIIALTGTGSLTERELCISAGMDGLIQKPFSPATLISKLSSLLDGSAQPELSASLSLPTIEADRALNVWSLHESWGANIGYTERMLQIAERELPATAEQMQAALSVGEQVRVGKLAHRVRPCVEGLRLPGLASSLLRLELIADGSQPVSELNTLVNQVSDELNRLASEISESLSGFRYQLA